MPNSQDHDGEYSRRAILLKEEIAVELGTVPKSVQLKRRPEQFPWVWVISSLIFAYTTAILAVWLLYFKGHCSTSAIELVETTQVNIKFTGALTWAENGTLINEYAPGERLWVGEPSPEIDAMWDKLEEVWLVMLEGDEANNVRDKTLLQNGYWLTGLDVFHQLHCLDSLRRGLYPEYYPSRASQRTERLHLDHCVDYLRQVLMCHADATPVNQKWYPQSNRYGPDFATVHVCRPFDNLVEWSRVRNPTAREGTRGREVAKDPSAIVKESSHSHKHEDGHWQ